MCVYTHIAYNSLYTSYVYTYQAGFQHAFLHSENMKKCRIWQKGAGLSWVFLLFEIHLAPTECQGTEQECNVDKGAAIPNSEQRGMWRAEGVKGSRQIRSESWFERLMVISHGR